MEEKEKSEKTSALYDLTTLQRDANRILGFTAQQTLDYLQSLYEKKLCTYPRTDSCFLTDDMEGNVAGIADIAVGICGASASAVNATQVCNSKMDELVSAGFVERKKNKKAVNLIPQEVGVSLITVLPEQLHRRF